MRMIVGLDAPTAGRSRSTAVATATCRRRCTRSARCWRRAPSTRAARPCNHLRALGADPRHPARRVDEVIDLVGLQPVARKRAGTFSLGMGQRLGIASALLGDPDALVLDEPVNGLDPEGIHWIRTLLRRLAAEGRTVFVSSHLMSEMALTADHLIVIGRGRLLADCSTADFTRGASTAVVRVRSPHATACASCCRPRA